MKEKAKGGTSSLMFKDKKYKQIVYKCKINTPDK